MYNSKGFRGDKNDKTIIKRGHFRGGKEDKENKNENKFKRVRRGHVQK